MTKRLRVGIIGLGRRWQRRYQPALLQLPDRFEVRALCDGVYQRAINEAYRLGCDAVAGPSQLLESDDIDAVLVLDPSWYRLWPLEAACRVAKPVFCCDTPDLDEDHADELHRLVQESRLLVMLEMALRFVPATARLRELLATSLGPARMVLVELVQPARHEVEFGRDERTPPLSPRGLLGAAGIGLLDWCAAVLGGGPASVLAAGTPDGGSATVFLEFGEGRAAQVTRWRAPASRRTLRLRVVAERGTATVLPPDRLRWSDAGGRHAHVLRRQGSIGAALLERFHQAVTEGQAPQPGLAEAYQVLTWLRAAAQSRAEGRRILLPGETDRGPKSPVETGGRDS